MEVEAVTVLLMLEEEVVLVVTLDLTTVTVLEKDPTDNIIGDRLSFEFLKETVIAAAVLVTSPVNV